MNETSDIENLEELKVMRRRIEKKQNRILKSEANLKSYKTIPYNIMRKD